MNKYTGIFPALVTPYKSNGKINEQSLQKIIRMNLEKGVKGFYVGGSTAEAFLLSIDERKYILDIVAQECKGKCTLISHIGCIGTDQAIELGKHSEALGFDAISSIPPFYYKFSFEEIKNYYFDIVNHVNLPMIIYNFPAFSGVSFNINNIKEFVEDKRFIGIKHTSYDLYQLEQMLKIDERLTVFNGHDEVFLGSLAMGAKSAIGSTYNFMAEKFIQIDKLYKESKMEEAHAVQVKANEIIEALIKVGVFQGVKYALELEGIECNGVRKPFRSLTEEDKKILDKVLR
jgi:N-acetylneuraminate lyase